MGEKPPIGREQIESDLEVFVRQGCPHCENAKTFLSQLEQRYPQLTVTVRDIGLGNPGPFTVTVILL